MTRDSASPRASTLPQRERAGSPSLVTRHSSLTIRRLGLIPYEQAWEAMRTFTSTRTPETADELWLLEHPPVYTYGVAGRPEHLPPADCGIQLIKVDRGGQVTYHGPGQLILYALIDLRRRGLGVRDLVRLLEQAVIDLLEELWRTGAAPARGPRRVCCWR